MAAFADQRFHFLGPLPMFPGSQQCGDSHPRKPQPSQRKKTHFPPIKSNSNLPTLKPETLCAGEENIFTFLLIFFSHQQWKGPTVSKLSAITLLVKCKSLSCVWLFATPWTQVHGILQPRILEWVAFLFSRGFSHPRDRTQVSRIAGRFFTSWATREAQESLSLLQWIFPTQESNQGLLHCRWILYQLSN